MDIPKEKLGLMGISIKANRKALLKETKAAKWTQLHFASDICSPNTLMNIERGKASRFPELYGQLASKLNLKFDYFPKVDKKLKEIISKLYIAVEYYDLKKIKYYTIYIINMLEDYKNVLWYKDVYDVFCKLDNYYRNDILLEDKDEVEKYIEMLEEFDPQLVDILKSFIFMKAFSAFEQNDFTKVFTQLEIESNEFLCNRSNTLLYYLNTEKTSKFYNLVDLLVAYCKENNNIVRLSDVYNTAIYFVSHVDRDLVEPYTSELINLLRKYKFPKTKLEDYYYTLGSSFFEISNYEKALYFLNKSLEYDSNFTRITFAYIASCQKKLNLEIDIPEISKTKLMRMCKDDRLMYKYYRMNKEIPAFIKQKFIMEELLPEFRQGDNLCINLIRDELTEIIQETNQYKDSIIYDIKTRELIIK